VSRVSCRVWQMIIFALYSFWVPQIVMNAYKGVRQPLNRAYVVGMSLTRLVIPLYVYGCPQNFVHLLFNEYRPDYRVCLGGWCESMHREESGGPGVVLDTRGLWEDETSQEERWLMGDPSG
jgi:hypothetical protein